MKTHPARAARVALMHTWQSTQTEGWWRQALDFNGIPYDYISTQDVANEPNLRAKYDVILFGPGGGAGQAIIDGLPMWRNPMPWKKTDQTPNLGGIDETDDIRPGLGWTGLMHLEDFIKKGGVYVGAVGSAQFALQFGLTDGVSANTAGTGSRVVGSLLRTQIVDDAHPIVYGIPDNLAVYSDAGASFTVSSGAGGRGGGGGGAAAAAGGRGGGPGPRATGRGTPDDPDVPQGRPALDPRNEAPARGAAPRPWQYAIPTEDQLRTPLNIIPPGSASARGVAIRGSERTAGLRPAAGRRRHRAAARRRVGPVGTGPRRALRQQPDLARRDDRQLLHGLERDSQFRQARARAGRSTRGNRQWLIGIAMAEHRQLPIDAIANCSLFPNCQSAFRFAIVHRDCRLQCSAIVDCRLPLID